MVEPLVNDSYEVIRLPDTFGIAAVHAIEQTPAGPRGGADPGDDGVALIV